jgi:hypothetical protein
MSIVFFVFVCVFGCVFGFIFILFCLVGLKWTWDTVLLTDIHNPIHNKIHIENIVEHNLALARVRK